MLSAVATHKGGGLSFTNSWKGETKMGIGLRVSSEGGAGDGGHVSLNFNYFFSNCEYNRQTGTATDQRHLHVSFLVSLFSTLFWHACISVCIFGFKIAIAIAIEYIKMYYTRRALLGGSPLDRHCLCSNVPRRESIRLMYTVKCIKMYTRRVY